MVERARAAAFAEVGVFPDEIDAGQPPHLPISLSRTPVEVRSGLEWDRSALERYEWLRGHLDVPGDASAPLWMSRPHDDAVGSYGDQAIEWIERTQRITLRWWQRLAIVRQLEHREDGSLCHRTVLESAPRRAGKSLRIRGMALWRLAHAHLIGEVQNVVHTGNDLPICREIQRHAWRWAEDEGWIVARSNGKEAIEAHDGSRWLVRSQSGVYGFDAGLAIVDEAWDVSPDTVSEGLEPAMLERIWAQLHVTSTAHRRASSLMRGRLSAALAADDSETLLLVWAAPQGADVSDPEVWRAASPHWSEDRARMISSKYAAALAGQDDPEFDDPDPMSGFTSQYLNVWRLKESPTEIGTQVITTEAWSALRTETPDGLPAVVAVESHYSDGVSVAMAWRDDLSAVVSVVNAADLAQAAHILSTLGYRGTVLVGASLAADPALKGWRVKACAATSRNAALDLARLASETAVKHDGRTHLTDQVMALRTTPGTDGPRLRSTGRTDAVKACVWAVGAARQPDLGRPRILVPSQ